MNSDSIIFLFGAGVSIPAGTPNIKDITEAVISGNNVIRYSDCTYCILKPDGYTYLLNDMQSIKTPGYNMYREQVDRILKFINLIKIEIEKYYKNWPSRSINYEDIYFAIDQFYNCESGEYDNPAIKPFIEKYLPDIMPLLSGPYNYIDDRCEPYQLADEAMNYIRDIVWQKLALIPNNIDYLKTLFESCISDNQRQLEIFTLNHDMVIESALKKAEIKFCDGFSEPEGKMRYWDPTTFNSIESNVKLFKLHGSINWFRYRPDNGCRYNDYVGIPLDFDIDHIKDSSGRFQMPLDGRPMILVGTFNKMLNYTYSLYSEMHFQFHRALRENNIIIISGYSFSDRGINTKIAECLYNSKRNKLIIIHPEIKELKKNACGSIRNNWDEWYNNKQLILINKGIENTTWDKIENKII